MLFHLQIAPETISGRSEIKNIILGALGACHIHPREALSAFIPTCRTNRKLLPMGMKWPSACNVLNFEIMDETALSDKIVQNAGFLAYGVL